MNLFWTSWIPERFSLSGLIARRVYSSFAETRISAEYRLGLYPNLSFSYASESYASFSYASESYASFSYASSLLQNSKNLSRLAYSEKLRNNSGKQFENDPTGPFWSSVEPSVWSAILLILTAILLWKNPYHTVQLSAGFTRTEWTTGIGICLHLRAALILLVSQSWFSSAKLTGAEYSLLVRLSVMGQSLMVQSTDLMNFYLSVELQSFCFIILCSFQTNSLYCVEAGMKYFLLSAFASICLLLGTGFLYWSTAQTNLLCLSELVQLFPNDVSRHSYQIGIWRVSLALLWKLAAAPLHMWAVDVYQGSRSSVTLRISTLPKLALLGFWTSQWTSVWGNSFGNLLMIFSGASLILGAFGALSQTHLKRLLAFSSIGHMGFLLMPLCASIGAESAMLTHFRIYAITSIAVWGLLMWPWFRNPQICATPIYLSDLAIRWKTHPIAAWTLARIMTSLAGIPPFAGFLGKLSIFWWSRNSGQYALLFIALVSTLISCVYYLRFLRVMYLENPSEWNSTNQLTAGSAYIIAGCALSLTFFLWYSSPVTLLTVWLSSAISF
jgi:NADH-quinone oxidoreductase subunit N